MGGRAGNYGPAKQRATGIRVKTNHSLKSDQKVNRARQEKKFACFHLRSRKRHQNLPFPSPKKRLQTQQALPRRRVKIPPPHLGISDGLPPAICSKTHPAETPSCIRLLSVQTPTSQHHPPCSSTLKQKGRRAKFPPAPQTAKSHEPDLQPPNQALLVPCRHSSHLPPVP